MLYQAEPRPATRLLFYLTGVSYLCDPSDITVQPYSSIVNYPRVVVRTGCVTIQLRCRKGAPKKDLRLSRLTVDIRNRSTLRSRDHQSR